MGILSDIQKYHGADERPSERGGQVFGAPARTIFTELDPGDVHQKITVKDEQGQPLYWTRSSVFTLRGKTDVFDAGGAQVAHLEKKPISLHEEHYITLTDGRKLTLSNELWKLQGNVLGLNFTLFDQNGEPIALIGQKALSLHNRCSIDLYQPQYQELTAVIVIALQKMLAARRENTNNN